VGEETPEQRRHLALVRRGFQLWAGGDIEGLLEMAKYVEATSSIEAALDVARRREASGA
jgi:hypothetical protein